MTGGRVVVLGDPGPWICSGMTGGVIYCRQNPDWNLDSSAIRRRLSKTAKVTMLELDESDEAQVADLLAKYRQALEESGQPEAAARLDPLIAGTGRALHRALAGDPAGGSEHLDRIARPRASRAAAASGRAPRAPPWHPEPRPYPPSTAGSHRRMAEIAAPTRSSG